MKPVWDATAALYRRPMFGVVHLGDTVSVCCQDHKRFGPVCMCLKQFVSLRGNQTPSFSTNPGPLGGQTQVQHKHALELIAHIYSRNEYSLQ